MCCKKEEIILERKVKAFLKKRQFNLQNKRILIGVSGGPDSLALLHFLWRQQEQWNIYIVAAHVDHMFRGDESKQEALFVKGFCEERNIPFEMKQINVQSYIEETGRNPQAAAREKRYEFFAEVLEKHQLSVLALGHHGDDQVETILMRLTRGSTGKARSGIPFLRDFHNGIIIRPFLCLNREEIERYCLHYELNPRRDPSNDKDIYSRNRFRKVVLPFLRQENPHVHEHFQRLSEELDQDETLLISLAQKKLKDVILEHTDNEITVDIKGFESMPLPLQRRAIQLILNYLYKVRPASLSALHIEKILSIFESPHPSSSLDFPNGLKVVRSYQVCTFQFQVQTDPTPYSFELSEPGEVVLPNGDIIRMEFINGERQEGLGRDQFLIDFAEEQLPIVIRSRKNGDRMTVMGMDGTKKLKALFIDEKIPQVKRNAWPVVTNRFDEILWVPGLRKSKQSLTGASQNSQHRNILLTYISNDLLGGTTNDEKGY